MAGSPLNELKEEKDLIVLLGGCVVPPYFFLSLSQVEHSPPRPVVRADHPVGWKPKKYFGPRSLEQWFGPKSPHFGPLGYSQKAPCLAHLCRRRGRAPALEALDENPPPSGTVRVTIGDLMWGGMKLIPKEFELSVLISGAEIRLKKKSEFGPPNVGGPVLQNPLRFGVDQNAMDHEWVIRLRTAPTPTGWESWLVRFPAPFFDDVFLESRGAFLVPVVATETLEAMYESSHGRKRDNSKNDFPPDAFSAEQWKRTTHTLAERSDGGLESLKMEVSLQRSGEN